METKMNQSILTQTDNRFKDHKQFTDLEKNLLRKFILRNFI